MLETNCLTLLEIVANCFTPDIAILRWTVYIRSLNPILVHISDKKNSVVDVLSKARYVCEEKETHEIGEDEENESCGYMLAIDGANTSDEDQTFREDFLRGKL